MVFQNYALFAHMTIGESLAFPLSVRGMDKSRRDGKIKRALDIGQLGEVADRRPSQLSGGQQQRLNDMAVSRMKGLIGIGRMRPGRLWPKASGVSRRVPCNPDRRGVGIFTQARR